MRDEESMTAGLEKAARYRIFMSPPTIACGRRRSGRNRERNNLIGARATMGAALKTRPLERVVLYLFGRGLERPGRRRRWMKRRAHTSHKRESELTNAASWWPEREVERLIEDRKNFPRRDRCAFDPIGPRANIKPTPTGPGDCGSRHGAACRPLSDTGLKPGACR